MATDTKTETRIDIGFFATGGMGFNIKLNRKVHRIVTIWAEILKHDELKVAPSPPWDKL